MRHKIYMFDFDGVLVNSTSYIGKGLVEFLDKHNISYPSDVVKFCMPLGYKGVAKYYHDELGLNIDVDEMEQLILDDIYYYYANEIKIKEGVIEYLKKLKAEGCSLNVLSAGAHRMMDACMERLGITDLFDHVWTCEDMGYKKSEIEIYQKAAELLGVSAEQIAFFDDNIVALSRAKEAGFYVVGVYDDSGKDFVEEMKEVGKKYIYSFLELDETEMEKK